MTYYKSLKNFMIMKFISLTRGNYQTRLADNLTYLTLKIGFLEVWFCTRVPKSLSLTSRWKSNVSGRPPSNPGSWHRTVRS